MKASKKSLYNKFKKYQTGGNTLPPFNDMYNLQSKQLGTTPTTMSGPDPSQVNITPTQNPNPRQIQDPNQDPNQVFVYNQAPTVDYSMFDVDLETPGIQQGPLPQGVEENRQLMTPTPLGTGLETPDPTKDQTKEDKKKNIDYNSLFTLGLAGVSTGLNFNADVQNTRRLNESIQQRQSNPVYDYNFMYGRTTTGGSQYQPVIKAEMGAQIQKRYNTPNSLNDVEIEGGEFIQLPDMSTEMAMGPSHSNGGVSTNLPNGSRVYSDTLKPMGSKKTFAQMAKKYDNTKYDKILDNKFAKQVDKDTAMLMKQKNQKMLDKLFMDQQLLNGNSNGEVMAKNGASIDNPGFRALPPAVQQKIISNMEYGGFSLPNPLYMEDGGDVPNTKYDGEYWMNPQLRNSPMLPYNPMANSVSTQKPQNFTGADKLPWNNTSQPDPSVYTAEDFLNPQLRNSPMMPYNPMAGNVGGANSGTQSTQSTTPQTPRSSGPRKGVTSGNKTTTNNTNTATTPTTSSTSGNASSSGSEFPLSNENKKGIQTYTEDEIKMIQRFDPEFNPMKASVPGMQRTVDGVYGSTKNIDIFKKNYDWYLPKFKEEFGREFDPKNKKDVGMAQKAYQEEMTNRFIKAGYTPEEASAALNQVGFVSEKGLPNTFDEKLGFYTATRELFNPKEKTPPPITPEPDPKKTPEPDPTDDSSKTPEFEGAKERDPGGYTKQAFPLLQAVPDMMGLANAQEIYSYAIPEVDAPYLRPQEMQIQSELQNIRNMGQAAVRAGADPLSTYIAGTTAMDPVFQRKQNFDAQQRGQTDIRNAAMQQQADAMNAQMFDRTYNNLIAQARDAQTAEKQRAITSLIEKKAKHDQSENIKEAYINNLTDAFKVGEKGPSSFEVSDTTSPIVNSGYMSQDDANVVANEVKKNLAEKAKAAKGKTSQTSKTSKTKTSKKK